MKLSMVILTRNEIEGIAVIVPRIPMDAVDEVIVVDGNSTDGTKEFFEARGIKVISQKAPGRGEAFRVAMEHVTGDAVLFFSPDGNEDPADIPRFRPLLEQGNDIVIASRMMKGAYNEEDENTFRWRKWANNAFNLMANVAFRRSGPYITDSINGFRAITRKAYDMLKIDSKGYTIEYQMTIRAFKSRLKIVEFPTHEAARIGGESQAKSIPTGIRFLKLFFRELFRP